MEVVMRRLRSLTTETIQSTALALQSIDDIEGGDGLALGVLSVGDSITDDTLEEGLQNTTGLFVDHCDDALDSWFQISESDRITYWLRYA
jgi:hypothetical protein